MNNSGYIITGEELNQINTRTTKNPLGEGHGSKFLPLAYWERQIIIDEVMTRAYNPQAEREKQCETCKHKGTRACMSHGYEDLPESCSYKLGVNAEEAMKNLNGTHIDVWTMKHDKEVREKVLDEYNDELLTKLVQELAGTWRMRDAKLFSIIRKYRRVPIGAMKAELRQKDGE